MARVTISDLQAQLAQQNEELERVRQRLAEARELLVRQQAVFDLIRTLVEDIKR